MKVHTDFDFTDTQLRTIRAAHGRGGAATRKECRVFILRAVEGALKAAPEPKVKRRPVPKKVTPPPIVRTADEDTAHALAQREKIRRLYVKADGSDGSGGLA